ncbi:17821_t:CDS:2, partial [Racocetra fulgida]
ITNVISLAIFAGYTIVIRQRQIVLEKKNGKEQKQIDELKKEELQEKVKPGVKPSHLKRSKSLNDLPSQESEEIFVDAPEENAEELKQKITQLEDQILQLRISKLKDFGDYWEKNKELKKDLESNIDYGVKEIERLETKLRTVNKKKFELQEQLGQSQSEKARLEIKLINAENKEAKPIATRTEQMENQVSQKLNEYGGKAREQINKPFDYYRKQESFYRVAKWATEVGIDVNQKWNLRDLKGDNNLPQLKEELFSQGQKTFNQLKEQLNKSTMA